MFLLPHSPYQNHTESGKVIYHIEIKSLEMDERGKGGEEGEGGNGGRGTVRGSFLLANYIQCL